MDLPPLGLGARPAVVDYIASWDVQWDDDFDVLRSDERANRDGVRDIDHALDAEADVLRFAFLGDGVTFGFWCSQAESYPALFEKLARERGLRIEALDIALPGWSTRQERRAYRQMARNDRPVLVVLGFRQNDVAEKQDNLARPPALLAAAYRHLNVVRWALHAREWELHCVEELFTHPDARWSGPAGTSRCGKSARSPTM